MNEQDLRQITHDTEQVLLASLLIDRDAIPSVVGILVPEAFHYGAHRVLYQAMLNLWDRRVPCDVATAIAEVRLMGYGEDRFPADYVYKLLSMTKTAVHAPHYAADVLRLAKRRAIIDAGSALVRAGYGPDDGCDTTELVASVRSRVEPFEAVSRNDAVSLASAAPDHALEAVETWEGARIDPVVSSGMRQLDRMLTGGFRPGQLIMVGARPGMGKTALMLMLALSSRVHLVSLEMSKKEILNRLVALCGNVPYSVAHDMVAPLDLRERWLDGADAAAKLPISLSDRPRQTTLQIESDVARMVAEQGTELLVIDHLDWLGDKARFDSQEQRTAELVHRCKSMARALGIPVVVLAQLNRNVEHRPGFMPHLSDFRNSGAIEQDADVAILLHRRRYYSERGMLADDADEDWITGTNLHRAEVIVAKNRNGAIGTVRLGWQPDVMRFVDLSEARAA